MADVLSNPHLAAWDASLVSSGTYARQAAGELSSSSLLRRPSWGGWSVGEVFEHLCVTDGLYEAPLRALLTAERERTTPRHSNAWRPTIWGRLLLWSLNPANTRKSQAPPAFRIGDAPRARVVAAWLSQVETTRALMREADGLDLRRLKLSSPAARVIRLNAGDAFAVLAMHAERHMGQVRRTIADVAGAVAPTDRA
jgi:hypothetical protein